MVKSPSACYRMSPLCSTICKRSAKRLRNEESFGPPPPPPPLLPPSCSLVSLLGTFPGDPRPRSVHLRAFPIVRAPRFDISLLRADGWRSFPCYVRVTCVLCMRAMCVLCTCYVRGLFVLCGCYPRPICRPCACYACALCVLCSCYVAAVCLPYCYSKQRYRKLLVRVTLG